VTEENATTVPLLSTAPTSCPGSADVLMEQPQSVAAEFGSTAGVEILAADQHKAGAPVAEPPRDLLPTHHSEGAHCCPPGQSMTFWPTAELALISR
jgi:hypothetical protein